MKYAIVIVGGAADEPLDELGGKTPLEAARCPTLKRMGESGRFGQVTVLPEPIEPTPDAAMISLLGYDPAAHYPGNAPLRAIGLGVGAGPGDWAFNLSLLSVDAGVVTAADTAVLPVAEARALIEGFVDQLEMPGCVVHPTDQPMHLLLDPASSGRDWSELATAPPATILGQPMRKVLPRGGPAGERMQSLIAHSEVYLRGHEINQARLEMGEHPVTHLWPWGHGQVPTLPRWSDLHRKTAAVLTDDPTVRGLAMRLGIDPIDTPMGEGILQHTEGALVSIGADAVAALDSYDLVIVDCAAPAAAALDGHAANKVDAIQLIDRHLLKPLEIALAARGEDYRLLATPLYAALTDTPCYESPPVPFIVTGYKMQGVVPRPFTEAAADAADLKVRFGHELMEYFLKSGVRG